MPILSVSVHASENQNICKINFDTSGVALVIGLNQSGKSNTLNKFSIKENNIIEFDPSYEQMMKINSIPIFNSAHEIWQGMDFDKILVKNSRNKTIINLVREILRRLEKHSEGFAKHSVRAKDTHEIFTLKIRDNQDDLLKYHWIKDAVDDHGFLKYDLENDINWFESISYVEKWLDEVRDSIIVKQVELHGDKFEWEYHYFENMLSDGEFQNANRYISHLLTLAGIKTNELFENLFNKNEDKMDSYRASLQDLLSKKIGLAQESIAVEIEPYVNKTYKDVRCFTLKVRIDKDAITRSTLSFITIYLNGGIYGENSMLLIDNFGDGLTPNNQIRLMEITKEIASTVICRYIIVTNNFMALNYNLTHKSNNAYLCYKNALDNKSTLIPIHDAVKKDHVKILSELKYHH